MPPLKKLSFAIQPEMTGKRIDQALSELLPPALGMPVSKAKVRKLVIAGAVYLNGRRVRIASKELINGAKLEAFVDLAKLNSDERAQDRPFLLTARQVLFEDEFLIVIDKPPGLPTQPTLDEARENLFASVKRFIAERDRVIDPYVGLHHRLDRDTSGVILFTKKKEANAGISRIFTTHEAQKTYHALTQKGVKPPAETWKTRNYLGRAPGPGKQARFTAVRSGGDPAETDFRVLERTARGLYIEAKPRTGRTHQIRVHLSEEGYPILGDATYGKREGAPRLMLHAFTLEFPHPITQAVLRVNSPLPEDFRRCLQELRDS